MIKANARIGSSATGMDARLILAAILLAIVSIAGFATPSLAGEPTGTIAGTVVDTKSGDALIGATVQVKGTNLGAKVDLDGKFTVRNVPLGTYEIIVRSVGYTEVTITGVAVEESEVHRLDVALTEESVQLDKTITVTAKQMKNNEAALLKERSKAVASQDAISAEQITKSGASDAADAMTKVVGASVVGGKFVYVRGLGDRYSNVNINGSPLPSSDPDKQSVPLDMVPSGLLDNIVVQKTFTPDKAGNFTGGSVDLVTRDFPEYRQLTFSTSIGHNNAITGSPNMLSTPAGSKDWAGYDDGKRSIPGEIDDRPGLDIPEGINFINGMPTDDTLGLINYMETASKAFDPKMQPIRRDAPYDQKYALSYGDQFALFDRPLGVIASLSYSKSYRGYADGVNRQYQASSPDASALTPYWDMKEQKGSEEVLWGGLANLNYTLHPNHKIGSKLTYNQSGTNQATYLQGQALDISGQRPEVIFRTRLMEYTERNLQAIQFSGEHSLPVLNRSRLDWNISFAKTTQENPDRRQFADEVVPNYVEDPITGDLIVDGNAYAINPSAYTVPTRFYRDLSETNDNYSIDYTLPYHGSSKLKVGAFYMEKYRESFERQYRYTRTGTYNNFDGDIDAYFAEVGVDTVIVNPNTGRYQWRFDNYVYEFALPNNNYRGTQEVFAWYGMVEHQLLNWLRVVGGARVEQTDMRTETGYNPLLAGFNNGQTAGEIFETDVLPSVNLIFALSNTMNVRTSYGKTLARPSLLEMTPVIYESWSGGRQIYGNPNLERTLVDNYDLRWEWFMRPGEILAVSGFYKYFDKPIEQVIFDVNGNILYKNVPDAKVYGLELEFRRRLDHVTPALRFFSVGGNLTLVHSEIKLDAAEAAIVLDADPNADDTRPMQGQSPYIVNFDIGYDNPESGTTLNLLYNVFGERLHFNSEDYTPDIYEQAHNQVDIIASQRIFNSMKFRLSVKNVLDEDIRFTQDFKGQEFIAEAYRPGRSISVGVSYSL